MTAAFELAAPRPEPLIPAGQPVLDGRLTLGRLIDRFAGHEGTLAVAAGFGTVGWIGAVGAEPPDLGRLAWHGRARVDLRDRLMLERRVRVYLAVADVARFNVVLIPIDEGGLLVVPVEGFATRVVAVTP